MKENENQPSNDRQNEELLDQDREHNPDVLTSSDHNGTFDNERVSPVQGAASGSPGYPEERQGGGSGGGKGWMVVSLLLAAALIVVFIVRPFGKETGNEAVASVNNVDITKDKLYDSLVEAGGAQTLDGLITEELLKQELGKKSIQISDDEITQEIESVKSMFPSEEQFNTALASSGMTMDDLKDQTKMQLELTKLLGDKVNVTDDEVKQMYDQYKDSFATPEQVRASHILVETEEEAADIIKQLDEGADFAAIADEKNEDGTKGKGGDLGFFAEQGQMDPAFSEAAFKLEKGAHSKEPVKSSFGYHVIKVTDRKEATNPTLEDKKEDLRKQLVSTKVSEQSGPFLQELKDKAKITNTLEEKEEAADPAAEGTEEPVTQP
ncbi:peptidyl-prolyl cis-trans isomerase [Paenibacillus lemnae]|uniref:Foldase protein PrsA n=1 Tax=Paenibacillus lemnae TaxID=1330551 RepID=A0A848M5U7_PAELE|nr:peptidyl-prolyl cis-trans isomerase [Paenibacillus lemnae]NMO96518.1 peptidylprolyl isomerase [Paenibacillus lemnae]